VYYENDGNRLINQLNGYLYRKSLLHNHLKNDQKTKNTESSPNILHRVSKRELRFREYKIDRESNRGHNKKAQPSMDCA
jgi:hypothetical protein